MLQATFWLVEIDGLWLVKNSGSQLVMVPWDSSTQCLRHSRFGRPLKALRRGSESHSAVVPRRRRVVVLLAELQPHVPHLKAKLLWFN